MWEKAPSWAKWIAQEQDGKWWWFSVRPTAFTSGNWVIEGVGTAEMAYVSPPSHNWTDTLRERPQEI